MGVAVIVMVLFAAGFFLIFLDSGANRGRVILLDQRAYPSGTVTHVPERGFFLVHLGDDLFAVDDLDAANRVQAGRRCRVRSVGTGDPGGAELLAANKARLSPEARDTALLLTEDCNSAVYDAAGTRLDEDGPNLDRLAVSIDEAGRVVVDTQDRLCTSREPGELRAERDCRAR